MKIASKVIVERKHRPFWQILLIILVGIVLINYLITLCNILGEKYAGIASVAVLLASLTICTFIIIRLLSSFSYTLEEDRLFFERVIGKKKDLILCIKLDEIISIKPYRDVKEKDKGIEYTYSFICTKEYDEFYVGEFEKDLKRYRFIFKPTERLLQIIEKEIEGKRDQSL